MIVSVYLLMLTCRMLVKSLHIIMSLCTVYDTLKLCAYELILFSLCMHVQVRELSRQLVASEQRQLSLGGELEALQRRREEGQHWVTEKQVGIARGGGGGRFGFHFVA